jgi:hypothetical protein
MPQFYFHLLNDMDVPDREGKDLPSVDAAREMAICEAQKLIGHKIIEQARINLNHRIVIEDEEGRALDTVWFRDVVEIER